MLYVDIDLFVFNFNGNVMRLLDLFWCHYFVGKNMRFWMIMHTIWHLPLHFLFQKIAFFIFIFLKGKNCILQLMGFFFKNAVLKRKTLLSYCSFPLRQNFLQTLPNAQLHFKNHIFKTHVFKQLTQTDTYGPFGTCV